MPRMLIIGATSAIAQATARLFAQDGNRLSLVARNKEKLEIVAEDLRVRGAEQVETHVMDATDFQRHHEVIEESKSKLGGLDTVFIAHGILPDQQACENSFEQTYEAIQINYISVISMLTILANEFEQRRTGTLVVITSVAGDRGKRSNYIYGSAKGGLNVYLQGLRQRLARSGVKVLTVKPGFVDTPMTATFPKGLLWVSPAVIANGIYLAIQRNRDVVYLPWFWRYIMWVIKALPERLFSRLSL